MSKKKPTAQEIARRLNFSLLQDINKTEVLMETLLKKPSFRRWWIAQKKWQQANRLIRMAEIALESEAFKSRTPTFSCLDFCHEFEDEQVVSDWATLGIIIDLDALCQPGRFVAKLIEMKQARQVLETCMTREAKDSDGARLHKYTRYHTDKYGRRAWPVTKEDNVADNNKR